MAVRQELRAARLLGETLEEMLAGGSTGIVYLDRAGAIVGSNDAAERTLRSPGGLFDRCGQLRARHPDDDARLGEILNGALRRHAAGARPAVSLPFVGNLANCPSRSMSCL